MTTRLANDKLRLRKFCHIVVKLELFLLIGVDRLRTFILKELRNRLAFSLNICDVIAIYLLSAQSQLNTAFLSFALSFLFLISTIKKWPGSSWSPGTWSRSIALKYIANIAYHFASQSFIEYLSRLASSRTLHQFLAFVRSRWRELSATSPSLAFALSPYRRKSDNNIYIFQT